jgi:hypothetical protein
MRPRLSRYFVIAFAAVMAVWRARDHAWVETIGLAALSIGLSCSLLAQTKQQPLLKYVAIACFAVTLVAMGMVFQRDYLH